MSRRIVDLKDINTGDFVYPSTHSDAVFMPDGKTVTEAIANAGGGVSNGSTRIDVTASGEYAIVKGMVNYVQFNIGTEDKACSFAFQDSPVYDDIIAGGWAEYKLCFRYDQDAAISFNAGIIWSESCDTPIFEVGYIYEFSFVPIAFDSKVAWLGLWSKTAEKNVITIEFAYDSFYEVYTLTASEPIASRIVFLFNNGLFLSMPAGETYVETSAAVYGLPTMHLNEMSGDVVADDYNIYKLIDKT